MAFERLTSNRRLATPAALAAVSLVSAIALWIVVTQAEDPSQSAAFSNIEVKAVNVPEGLAVAGIREPGVSIRVSAPESKLRDLTLSDFRAEINLSGARPGTSELRVIAESRESGVGIVEVQPAFVTVVLEPLITRQVPVRPKLLGAVPQGYSVGEAEANPAQVRISGATSTVQQVAAAEADVNLTGLRVSGRQQYPLVPRDASGADIKGVRVEPASAEVRLAVVQQEVTLIFTIQPKLQGAVADGYNLTGITPDPPFVAVSGPLDLLQAVTTLSTEPLDLSSLRADTVRSVRLQLPTGLTARPDTVNVRLRIQPATGEILLPVVPNVTGLGEGLHYSLQTLSVSVRLSGELPTLRSLAPGSVRATASVSGRGEGVHVIDLTVSAPDSVKVVSFDPAQVVLTISR